MVAVDPNIAALRNIASALGPLREEVLFVGGATAGLLITDPAAMAIRATDDVDCIVEIASTTEYYAFECRLRARGFSSDPGLVCRHRFDGIALDVMPTDPSILGFANRWAAEAFSAGKRHALAKDLHINIIDAPYFVATRLEAFYGRGDGDFVASHDIEDLVVIVDGRRELVDEVTILNNEALKTYLRGQFTMLMANPRFVEALSAHLPPDAASQLRLPTLKSVLRRLGEVVPS